VGRTRDRCLGPASRAPYQAAISRWGIAHKCRVERCNSRKREGPRDQDIDGPYDGPRDVIASRALIGCRPRCFACLNVVRDLCANEARSGSISRYQKGRGNRCLPAVLWLSPGRDMCPGVHDAPEVGGSVPSAPTLSTRTFAVQVSEGRSRGGHF
jgi:hypothetical protein